ncbi:MAG: copper resistance protein CopC/CopD [Chloroflexi bacterium]|nr:copper resistance protein CopC/CopD [Chloroflexota bacterium]
MALVLIALSTNAAPANAHAIVVRTDPPDGASLADAPSQVRLWFSEPILLNFTRIDLVDSQGQNIPVQIARAEDDAEFVLAVHVPPLAPNAYRLSWRTVANDDVHPSSGSIVFGVRQTATPDAPTILAPSLPEVWLRWLNVSALAGLIGALAILFFAMRGHAESNAALAASVRRRTWVWAFGACALSFTAGVGLIFLQANSAGNDGWQILVQASYGARAILRQSLVAILGALIFAGVIATRRAKSFLESRATRVAILGLVLALVTLEASNSHTANGGSPMAIIAGALHLLAAGVWGGGLVAMSLVLVPLLRRGLTEQALARAVLRRFGALAALGLGVLLATGLYNSGVQVASLDALLVTLYGQTLLIKVGLALSLALIGLLNATLLHSRVADFLRARLRRSSGWLPLESRHLWKTVAVETLGALTVFWLASALSATPPALGSEFDPPSAPAATVPSVATYASDLFITFSIKPNLPGKNFIMLGVFDTRRPSPAPIERVVVRLVAPNESRGVLTRDATSLGGGKYQLGGDLINVPGAWNASVIVSRPGLPDATVTIPWRVSEITSAEPRPVLVSNRPLAPITTIVALVVAFGLLGVSTTWLTRRVVSPDSNTPQKENAPVPPMNKRVARQ